MTKYINPITSELKFMKEINAAIELFENLESKLYDLDGYSSNNKAECRAGTFQSGVASLSTIVYEIKGYRKALSYLRRSFLKDSFLDTEDSENMLMKISCNKCGFSQERQASTCWAIPFDFEECPKKKPLFGDRECELMFKMVDVTDQQGK